MKQYYYLGLLCFFSGVYKAQYTVEWLKTTPGIVNFIEYNEKHGLLFTGPWTGELGASGQYSWRDSCDCHRNYISKRNDLIHEIGNVHLIRNINGKVIESHKLHWEGGTEIEPANPRILNNSLFGTFANEIVKYDLMGNLLNRFTIAQLGCYIQKMEIADNHLYLYNITYGSPEGGILKYDTLGNRIWQVDPGMFVQNIVTDENGNCHVLGFTLGGKGCVRKIDRDGIILWTQLYDSITIRNGAPLSDRFYICGKDQTTNMAFYAVLDLLTGNLIEKTGLQLSELGPIKNAEWTSFTHIVPTEQAIYLGGEHGGFYPNSFIAKFSDPRYVSVKEKNSETKAINVFPNPAGGEISVTFNGWNNNAAVDLTLRDQLGRVVRQETYTMSEFASKEIKMKAPGAKGVYILTVRQGGDRYTEKLIFD